MIFGKLFTQRLKVDIEFTLLKGIVFLFKNDPQLPEVLGGGVRYLVADLHSRCGLPNNLRRSLAEMGGVATVFQGIEVFR